ncbi:MAG: ABC transporter ATP-binding protein [Clostridiaceae bacterium]|nr:ABC transporter ATP-binding protein [Clostridiaceae bacterium]
MLIVKDIYKSYKKETVLSGISFDVDAGNIIGISGANGAGKTTLINIIASVLEPDKGEITLNNISLSDRSAYRNQIGYVPQSIALSSRLSVYRNLEFWGAIRGLRGLELKQAIESAAEQSNVKDFLKKPVGQCSGGMARRVNLAAGIIGNPFLILLDEPTTGIDEINRDIILDSIRTLRNSGRIVLMVNHYADEMRNLCDRIIQIKAGVIHDAP